MSNLDKNIIITPNVGASDDPKIVFSAANTTSNSANITIRAYPTSNGTLSFEGSAGQLFSITNNLTGSLFSVNDISGIPSIEVLDTGRVNLAQYNGSVVIGANTSATTSNSNTTGELVVFGGVGVTGNLYVGGTNAGANGIYTDVLRYAANGLPWVMGSGSGGGATPSGYLANTIIVANSTGFLSNSNSFFVASNNAIVVPNVVITQVATASFPLSFGQGLGNKIALYEGTIPTQGTGYGFGIQAGQLQIFHQQAANFTSFGHGNSSSFTEQFRIASVASAVNYLQVSGNTTGATPTVTSAGSDTNVGQTFLMKGAGKVSFYDTQAQGAVSNPFRINLANTQYSSVIGVPSKIDFFDNRFGLGLSGSQMEYLVSNGSYHTFFGGSAAKQFAILATTSAVNHLQVTGSTTSNTPALSVQGSDTNASMSLLPKGTGGVLINQTYNQNTVNVGSTLQVTGNVAANGAIVAQNLYIQGGSNWLAQSANLQSGIWVTHSNDANTTVTVNNTVPAPDGSFTAWQLNNNGLQIRPDYGIYQATGSSSGPWIASVWLRAGSLSSARIMLSGSGDDNNVANTLVLLTSTWQRFVISGVTGAPFSGTTGVRLKLSTNAVAGNYLVWGPQVELGNPTSPRNVASPYIPTFGSAVIVPLNNNIFATSNISSANVIVSNIVGFANSNNIVSVYQTYNASTNSLDVVFG